MTSLGPALPAAQPYMPACKNALTPCCENCWDSEGKIRGPQAIPGNSPIWDFGNKKGISSSLNDLLILLKWDLLLIIAIAAIYPSSIIVIQLAVSCGS
jgi:hypothetical protein